MARFGNNKGWPLVDDLLAVAKVDTAFLDLYLQRARELVSAELTEAQYAALEELDNEVARLASRIQAGIADRDWSLVCELTSRATDLKRAVAEQDMVRSIAGRVYRFDAVLVDPFSPGISGLAGIAERELPTLRDGAARVLERLCAADPACADLYEARRKALKALNFVAASTATERETVAEDATLTVEALQERAQSALVQGDLARLHQLSAKLLQLERSGAARGGAAGGLLTPPPLVKPFLQETCVRASKLGLAPHRVESRAEDVVARFRPSWQATPADPSGTTMRLSLTVPGDTDEAQRVTAELFMSHAFVTSAGTRYIPWMVAEDVLVEQFDEAPPGAPIAVSPLLPALAIPRRNGLARSEIEKALRVRGAGVVKDLGLDPREYRIACIPADVYTRVGAKLGWGKQEIWTHFDGYMVSKQRKLMPLVGGDARFGGLHDLVAVSPDYDSDRLYARFAIIQRRRFVMW